MENTTSSEKTTLFSYFTNKYSLNKTLRFELKPVGKTFKWDGEDGYLKTTFFKNDKKRYNAYPIVKTLLDHLHRCFIEDSMKEDSMKNVDVDWNNLAELYQKDKKSDSFKKEQAKVRKQIVKYSFKQNENWESIEKKHSELINDILPTLLNDETFVAEVQDKKPEYTKESMLYAIKQFKSEKKTEETDDRPGFTGYFHNYYTNRKNMYSDEAKDTAISNRLVNENFPRFMDNISVYEKLKKECPNKISEVENNLKSIETICNIFGDLKLDEVFVPNSFNKLLSQKGIDAFLDILGGKKDENSQIEGLNSVGNKFLQENPNSTLKLKELKFTKLHKQILSEIDRASYIPEQFHSENQIIESITEFHNTITKNKTFDRLRECLATLSKNDNSIDLEKIFIVGKSLTFLSKELYGNWDTLGKLLREKYVTGNSKGAKQDREKDVTEWLKNKSFSLADIINIEKNEKPPFGAIEILSKLSRIKKENDAFVLDTNLITQCNTEYVTAFNPLREIVIDGEKIHGDENKIKIVKKVLDAYLSLLQFAKLIHLGNKEAYLDKEAFYIEYNEIISELENIVPLYNKVRNFLTRKLNDEEKMLLKFNCSTLADGWDLNKEKNNLSIILRKNSRYYLGIITGEIKEFFDANDGEDYYEKMEYKYFPKASKMIPKCSTQRKEVKTHFDNNQEIYTLKDKTFGDKELYLTKRIFDLNNMVYDSELKSMDTKGKDDKRPKLFQKKYLEIFTDDKGNIDKEASIQYQKALEDWIEFCKDFLSKYESTSIYDFKFNDEPFESLDAFYDYIDSVTYKVKFDKKISVDLIENLQKENKIYLFEIHNKDFKENSTGNANLHTLYWKQLFDKANLENIIYQLNGKAEIFYRKPNENVSKKITHKKGDTLVNKTYSNGNPIPIENYREYVKFFKKEIQESELSEEAKKSLYLVKTNIAKLDLIKDKRYSEHKFHLHIPITLNFKDGNISPIQFNTYTLSKLRENKKDINIIGIDRGERHLLYVSIINQKGEMLEPPKSFNIMQSADEKRIFDYQKKLVQMEGDRKKARENWQKIGKIEDVKTGYLSLVVHEIAQLIVQHNAIVVLEDLNFGFKRGRFPVERQVYQKFERMLIEKLNYLVFKTPNKYSTEYGNLHNAIQLTAPFKSYEDMGKQSGWLFYVRPNYTSKIDPSTGFVNLFNMKSAKESPKDFFRKFDEIEYKDDLYQFKFDYTKDFDLVGTDFINSWTVCSNGERIIHEKNNGTGKYDFKTINLNEKLTKLFIKKNITNEFLSRDIIMKIEDSKFFEDLLYYFKLCLQMRNSSFKEDYLISPIKKNGVFFDSRNNIIKDADANIKDPDANIKDADANGAYHIALKGLYLIENNFPTTDKDVIINITNQEWLQFVQNKRK